MGVELEVQYFVVEILKIIEVSLEKRIGPTYYPQNHRPSLVVNRAQACGGNNVKILTASSMRVQTCKRV